MTVTTRTRTGAKAPHGSTATRRFRPRHPSPYAVFGGLAWLVLTLASWRVPMCCDYGQHAAVVERLRESLMHPRHPLVDLPGDGNPYYSPYALAQGAFARLTGLNGIETVRLATPFNLAVLLTGLNRLVRALTPRPWAPVWALLAVTLLWGTERAWWSGFLNLMSSTGHAGYPSAFALGATLWAWALTADRVHAADGNGNRGGACDGRGGTGRGDHGNGGENKGGGSDPTTARDRPGVRFVGPRGLPGLPGYAALGVLYGLILLTHPVTFVAAALGALAFVAASPRALTPALLGRWATAATVALALALAWPYADVLALAGDRGLDVMHRQLYDRLPERFWLAVVLGLPALVLRARRAGRPWRDPLTLLFLLDCAALAYGWLSGHWTYARLLGPALLPLQVALAVELAAPRPWPRWRKALGAAAAAGAVCGLLTVHAGALVPSDRLDQPPHWPSYDWAARHVGRGETLLADGYFAPRLLPGYGVDLVAPPWPDPVLGDRERGRRLEATARYLDPATGRAGREAVVRRYRVRWLLLTRWRRTPEEAVVVAWSRETGEVLARVGR
ncbi:hypothetical protein [Streptomyces fragilis]|uniref:Integral membrane protein n=1 Tax=Streptomyces fragilis TaxID=67301 RepID=A0ABV2YDU5_9ACTN|nr:hypothetical protein [Streptomyces fragilis]